MMYYMDRRHAVPFMSCMESGSREQFRHIPAEANVPIAVSPDQMSSMMHMGHAAGTVWNALPSLLPSLPSFPFCFLGNKLHLNKTQNEQKIKIKEAKAVKVKTT